MVAAESSLSEPITNCVVLSYAVSLFRFHSLTVTNAKTYQRLLMEGEPMPPFQAVLNNPELLEAILQEPKK